MKKIIIKTVAYIFTFIIFLLIFGKLMSRNQVNMTFDMDPASQPVVYMSIGDIRYNMLRGYSDERDISYMRDSLTYLDSDRSVRVTIDTFGEKVSEIKYVLRNIEDDRLIEEGNLDYDFNRIGNLEGILSLKDLMVSGAQYCLAFNMTLEDGRLIYYYTRVMSGDHDLAYNQVSYARFFHDCLLDKNEAEKIKKHLETNSSLNDNSTFAYVNIHSSFSQITYGDLEVEEYGEPAVTLIEQSGQDACIGIDYMLRSGFGSNLRAYHAHEAITVRYTEKSVYIMSYERTMEEITNPLNMCVNDKIVLGIADEDPEMMESENGESVAFVSGGRLFSYNEGSGRFACAYSFYDFGSFDVRNICGKHGIRILDIDDEGNMIFAVYGYMNRGTHEGDVGIGIYSYEDSINSISEILYIPYEKSEEILMEATICILLWRIPFTESTVMKRPFVPRECSGREILFRPVKTRDSSLPWGMMLIFPIHILRLRILSRRIPLPYPAAPGNMSGSWDLSERTWFTELQNSRMLFMRPAEICASPCTGSVSVTEPECF